MLKRPEPRRPAGCISDLVFDEWLADELDAETVSALTSHIESCSRCRDRRRTLEEDAARFFDKAPWLGEAGSARLEEHLQPDPRARQSGRAEHLKRVWWVSSLGAALAAAAAFFLLVGPATEHPQIPSGPPEEYRGTAETSPERQRPGGTRSKGGPHMEFFVKRNQRVFRGSNGERVHPGDQLRFTVSLEEPRHVAIFSLDGAGVASIYHPVAGSTERVGPGRDIALPSSIELDDALGAERLYALFCPGKIDTERQRETLQRSRDVEPLEGCVVDRLRIEKVREP